MRFENDKLIWCGGRGTEFGSGTFAHCNAKVKTLARGHRATSRGFHDYTYMSVHMNIFWGREKLLGEGKASIFYRGLTRVPKSSTELLKVSGLHILLMFTVARLSFELNCHLLNP